MAAEFELDGVQRALLTRVREVAANQLRPVAERGVPGRVNRQLVKELGSTGLLARMFPGRTYRPQALELCLLREALATVSTEAETALALQGLGTYPVVHAGGPDLIFRWVPAVVAGDAVAALARSEEHTSELQSRPHLVCRLLLEKKKTR